MIDATEHLKVIEAKNADARIDSRILAEHLGVQHQNTFEMLKDYRADFEQLGILRFETGIITGRGKPQKFAMLNEDQSYLLLAYSRNTAKVRSLKVKLVKAFGEARRNRDLTQIEYLPTYRALHDEIHALAAGSQNEKFVHMNLNKLVNKCAGIEAGQRDTAVLPTRSMLVTAQMIAAAAMRAQQTTKKATPRQKLPCAGLALSSKSEPDMSANETAGASVSVVILSAQRRKMEQNHD